MGTLRQVGDKWRAEVRRKGLYTSENFPTKKAAQTWLARTETEYEAGRRGLIKKSFGDALDRYAKEVSIHKRGARWEKIRLALLGRDKIADRPLAELAPADFADWRDRRTAGRSPDENPERVVPLKPASVAREMALMRGVITIAIREWGWLQKNPMEGVRRPKPGNHRKRLPTEPEIEAIVAALGHTGGNPRTQQQRAAIAFLLALQTGMRAGEILGLTAEHCYARHVHLPMTKNGDSRDVPLTPAASDLIALVKPDVGRLFPMSSATLDVSFRRARDKCGIEGLTFHDSRHYFCTWAARKLAAVDLAKVIGHRNLSQLLVYYNPTVSEIADRIAS